MDKTDRPWESSSSEGRLLRSDRSFVPSRVLVMCPSSARTGSWEAAEPCWGDEVDIGVSGWVERGRVHTSGGSVSPQYFLQGHVNSLALILSRASLRAHSPFPLAAWRAVDTVQPAVGAGCPMRVHVAPNLSAPATATSSLGPFRWGPLWSFGGGIILRYQTLCRGLRRFIAK